MSEKGIDFVDRGAKYHRSKFREQANNLDYIKEWSKEAIIQEQAGHPDLPAGHTQRTLDRAQLDYDASVQGAAEFAKVHESQLHDLAVLHAHLGGVAINVEQPIVVGQQVEVHKA